MRQHRVAGDDVAEHQRGGSKTVHAARITAACPAIYSASYAHFAGVAGAAGGVGIAGAGLMLRLDDAAAGRPVLTGHDDWSWIHDEPRPTVSISNVASVVLPSALRVPSPM